MAELDKSDLRARIERLEKKVKELELKVDTGTSVSHGVDKESDSSQVEPGAAQVDSSSSPGASRWDTSNIQFGEQWLNRIGIGLLLIGVAFLFKYSIDQGWLIPPVRSAIGFGIGVLLFGGGLRLADEMKPLKQILLGGGIAVFYITGFASFQLYDFLPSVIVWTFMIVVTLLSLSLSLQQDEAILSVVGTLGAFGTPFMLYSGGGSVILLMCYTVLVLAGTTAVYMEKGWRSLLWSISLGGGLVLFVGIVNTAYDNEPATRFEHWALQSGAFIWLACAWLLPLYHEVLSKSDHSGRPSPDMLLDDETIDGNMRYRPSSTVHLMAFIVPLLMLIMTIGIWDLSMNGGGIVSIGLAAVASVLYVPMKNKSLPRLASTNAFLGLSMLTIGFVLMLEGNFLFMVLAIEAVAMRFIVKQTGDNRLGLSSHILFGIVLLWVVNSLYYSLGTASAVASIDAITQLLVIAAGGTLIPWLLKNADTGRIYQLASHVVFLLWLYQKFAIAENGQALVTISWALYAIVLLIYGFLRYHKNVRLVAMGTIFFVVGKLFLVDLSQLNAIWRILIFMTFGAVFLLLGYYWQSKWSKDEKSHIRNK